MHERARTRTTSGFDDAADVVVVGSGSAAATAALTAAKKACLRPDPGEVRQAGRYQCHVGAGTWVPANHHMRPRGLQDSPEETLTYLRATAPEGWAETEDELWQAFAENAPRMLEFVEATTPLGFALTHEADPWPSTRRKTGGRTVSPSRSAAASSARTPEAAPLDPAAHLHLPGAVPRHPAPLRLDRA